MTSLSSPSLSAKVKPGVSFADATRASTRKASAPVNQVLDISDSEDDALVSPLSTSSAKPLASPVAIGPLNADVSLLAATSLVNDTADDSLPTMKQIFDQVDAARKLKSAARSASSSSSLISSLMDVDEAPADALARKKAFLEEALHLFELNQEARTDSNGPQASQNSDRLAALFGRHAAKRSRSPPLASGDGPSLPLSSDDEGLSDYERREKKRLRATPTDVPPKPPTLSPAKVVPRKRVRKGVKDLIAQALETLESPDRPLTTDHLAPTAIPPATDDSLSPSDVPVTPPPTMKDPDLPSLSTSILLPLPPPSPTTPLPAPSTPKKQRKSKKGVMDLLAAVGADPLTPSPQSSPPAPQKSSTHVIEKRLLPPPKINELHLDSSDAIIRSTIRKIPYPLAAAIALKSWNPNLVGPGFVKFIAWSVQCPDMDAELALAFIVFESCGAFGNLARMDLAPIYCLRVSQSATRHHAVTQDGQPFVFLTTGFLETSQLISPSEVGLKQKYVKIIPHEGEHQRMGSAACTVFGFDSMKTQFAKDALQFSTRAEYSASASSHNQTPSRTKGAAPGMFTGSSAGGATRVAIDNFSLAHNAHVPVYDATDAEDFVVDRDLPQLSTKLPPWDGEIPHGSFVVVGYTMTAFFSNSREWTLGLNIQWAIVVGVPVSD